ncbi:hypothetical protein FG386_000727 [Cryptosporidium ryanae]|uniref:uncharacterized protein n=1 Tax=Cryptosporidium ryanae TaxID=515981 RepID=UPI00351A03CE|nr:hypothetical protein FG386_000727 [Cryptosporidium ryanae]
MILEQKSGEEIKRLTGRNIIWSPNDLGIPYLGLYEEHGKIGEEDYLRFGVRYIGDNKLNSNSNEKIIIGEIQGEILSLDSLVFRSKEYCYTELRSSLNWIWRYNGVVIDTRNITGILGFIQKTWKESDESNCQLEVIDGRLYVVTIPSVCIYPGDELVLSVNNNMDLLLPTVGDELMKIRTKSNKMEEIFDIINFKDSPKSYDLTTSPISTANTTTQNIGGMLEGFESPSSHKLTCNDDARKILIPYSLNCNNEHYCNFCSRNHNDPAVDGYGEFKFSAKIYRNALVFILGEKENVLNLTESQINYFDRWKSTSCDKEVYSIKSAHKINFRSKKGISIDTTTEVNENDQIKNIPIEILLVKNYLTRSTNEMLICEFQILRSDKSDVYNELGKKCYVSQSILFYYFFDKWMSEKIIEEYKYIRIPPPLMIEQHRQMLLPYPEGIYWNLDTLSWKYQTQKNNSKHVKYETNDNNSLEASINDHIAQEQEFVGISLSYENDAFELFKSYITICSIKYKSIYNSKYKENSDTPITLKTAKNWDSSGGSNVNSYKKKKIRNDVDKYKYSECDNNSYYKSNGKEFLNKVVNGNVSSGKIQDIIENCREISNINVINNNDKHLLNIISEDVNVISQQVEILLTPPYSTFIKFCMKRLGFSITYNKRRAWFSVKTRGVLEAFNLAIKWIKKQKNSNEKDNYSPINADDNLMNGNVRINNDIALPEGKNIQSENHNKKKFQKFGSIENNIRCFLNKNDNSVKSDLESDADSVYSFNEQANRLKPLPKKIIWVPSRRVFIVSYKRFGTLNQMNTKSFNPTIYGGVKKALKHACIFQSQTESCKYNNNSEISSRDNSKGSMGSGLVNDREEHHNIDTSLKPLNHWVKNIDSEVSPETVTSAYREAVSTYLTNSPTFSNQNIVVQEDKNNKLFCRTDQENNFQSHFTNEESENLGVNQISEDGIMNNISQCDSGRFESVSNSGSMNIDMYINNLNSDYLINNESNSINSLSSPINHDFGDKLYTNNDLFEYKPFKMYHDQVFLNKDSVCSLMNIDESINNTCINNRTSNDSTDGQTVILDEDTCFNSNGSTFDSINAFDTDHLNFFEGYRITEPLVSISDPYSNIFEFDSPPILHDQLVKIESPYGYIDSFTLIEP